MKIQPPRQNELSTPDEEPYSEDGVDLTLIRWMLSLTPAARLQVLQRNVWSILRLRAAGTRSETQLHQ